MKIDSGKLKEQAAANKRVGSGQPHAGARHVQVGEYGYRVGSLNGDYDNE